MPQELLYTSAPRGLRAGARGFCTVAATRGMSALLMEKLEGLSGYRALYPPHDARASLNPVAYAHVRIGLGGKTYSVLSRVSAAGLDYTERTNKLAHHLVLDSSELPVGGPAWLMRQPGVMDADWNGEVAWLPEGRTMPSGDSKTSVSKAWAEATGDAGWAGVVAESALNGGEQGVCLLFQPGTDMLALIAEALSLLRAELRWAVSFSTFSSTLPAGVECRWRCLVAGTPEAKNAEKLGRGLVLDLTSDLGQATGGPLVESARTGRPGSAALFAATESHRKTPTAHHLRNAADLDAMPYSVAADPQDRTPSRTPPPPPAATPPPQERAGRRWLLLAAATVFAFGVAGLVLYEWKFGRPGNAEQGPLPGPRLDSPADAAIVGVDSSKPVTTATAKEISKQRVAAAEAGSGHKIATPKTSNDVAPPPNGRAPWPSGKGGEPEGAVARAAPKDPERQHMKSAVDGYLVIPPWRHGNPNVSAHVSIAPVAAGSLPHLELVGLSKALIGETGSPLAPARAADGQLVIQTARSDLTPQTFFGSFAVEGDQLRFEWAPGASDAERHKRNREAAYRELRKCVLRVSDGKVAKHFALRETAESASFSLTPALSSDSVEDGDVLRIAPVKWTDPSDCRLPELLLQEAVISWRGKRIHLTEHSAGRQEELEARPDIAIRLREWVPKEGSDMTQASKYLYLKKLSLRLADNRQNLELRFKTETKNVPLASGKAEDFTERKLTPSTELRIESLHVYARLAGMHVEVFRVTDKGPENGAPKN